MVVGTKGLSRCLSDSWILQVGMIFGVAFGLFSAFAKDTIQLFLSKYSLSLSVSRERKVLTSSNVSCKENTHYRSNPHKGHTGGYKNSQTLYGFLKGLADIDYLAW